MTPRYHQRNRPRRLAQKRALAYHAYLAWYLSLKEGRPCADCGRNISAHGHAVGSPPRAAEKTGDLGKPDCAGTTSERVLEEIAKCELVCANCHAVRTLAPTRGVAQPGRALRLGRRGRQFNPAAPIEQSSDHSDHGTTASGRGSSSSIARYSSRCPSGSSKYTAAAGIHASTSARRLGAEERQRRAARARRRSGAASSRRARRRKRCAASRCSPTNRSPTDRASIGRARRSTGTQRRVQELQADGQPTTSR